MFSQQGSQRAESKTYLQVTQPVRTFRPVCWTADMLTTDSLSGVEEDGEQEKSVESAS